MSIGNVSIQTSGGASTLGVIPVSGFGFSFLNPLYRYANLTLPYSPNDPGLSFTYNNSTLAPVVLLYARFFNLLNESSVPLVVNVGTSAFAVSGGAISGAQDCLDVRGFGAVGDGVADDTAAIQAALDKAHLNYLGNLQQAGASTAGARLIQTATGHIQNGSGGTVSVALPGVPSLNNTLVLTFSAFDYGTVGSPAPPTVTDSNGNVWTQASKVQNGELLLYTYYAKVASANSTTVTITVGQRQFNSFICAVVAEFAGVLVPITLDGTATAISDNFSFTPPVLVPTGHADLVIYSVSLDLAGGVIPVPPGDFVLAAGAINPQPNGLNGAVPSTAMAYKSWTGIAPVNSSWVAIGFAGCSSMQAFRLLPTAPAAPGKTVVCIPQGVACVVSPQPTVDHTLDPNFWGADFPEQQYGPLAYSLVMNDGVTLRIDGALIANPNTNATAIADGSNFQGRFGWVLITNSAWLANTTLGTVVVTPFFQAPAIQWSDYIAGVAFNEGPRNTGIRITGIGKVYLNGQVQAGLYDTFWAAPNYDPSLGSGQPGFGGVGLARFYCVDNSSIDSLEIQNPWILGIEWGHSVGALVNSLYFHGAPASSELNNTLPISPHDMNNPGILEMDMLRSSKITGNTIINCPGSIGINDWAGYQNTFSGNKVQNCYSGYRYADTGAEFQWSFVDTSGTITHNSEITQNTVLDCVTALPNIVVGSGTTLDSGSDGFGFQVGGWNNFGIFLKVTGTGFHDNIANGNSTDSFFGPLMAFRSLSNNTFGPATVITNGLNTVTGEVPSGTINGSNVNFTLLHTPNAGSVVVFLNGLQQVLGTDFTVSGKVITFVVAPNAGSTVMVNYQYQSGS